MTVSGDGLLAFEWFQGDGASTTFDIGFYFLANEDLKFLVERENGTLDPVTPVQINGAGDPNGGSFTLAPAPLATERAGVFRDLSLGQPTDVEAQEDIPPAAIQVALDRLAMVDIQQQGDIERSIRLSDSDEPGDFRIPVQAERAGRYLAFDASGDPIARTITDIGEAEIATPAEAKAGTGDGLMTAVLVAQAILAQAPGRFLGRHIFTASGTYTKNPDARLIKVTVIGGGGSGARCFTGQNASGGAGAGAAVSWIDNALIGATESVQIGAGGPRTTTAGSHGTTGSSSFFGGHCRATGGGAGKTKSSDVSGGAPGVGTIGDLKFLGTASDPIDGDDTNTTSAGGGSLFAGGGAAAQNGVYGGGGGGAKSSGSGGKGGDGLVIVEEYS